MVFAMLWVVEAATARQINAHSWWITTTQALAMLQVLPSLDRVERQTDREIYWGKASP